MILRRDDAFRAVCELRTPIDQSSAKVGTGMFVSSPAGNNSIYGWIVTANHVARETTDSTDIVIATKDGKAAALKLSLFGPLSGWKHHQEAVFS